MEKPQVDQIDGILPAIAIDQRRPGEDVALDGRHDDRAARLPEAAVREGRRAALPQLRQAGRARRRRGRGDAAPGRARRGSARWSRSPCRCSRSCRGPRCAPGSSPRATSACSGATDAVELDDAPKAPARAAETLDVGAGPARRCGRPTAAASSSRSSRRSATAAAAPPSCCRTPAAPRALLDRARVRRAAASPCATRCRTSSRSTARSAPARPAAASAA